MKKLVLLLAVVAFVGTTTAVAANTISGVTVEMDGEKDHKDCDKKNCKKCKDKKACTKEKSATTTTTKSCSSKSTGKSCCSKKK